MNSLVTLFSPLALLLPAAAAELPGRSLEPQVAHVTVHGERPAMGLGLTPVEAFDPFEAAREPVERQVRIEQRVIIRIAPSSPATRERMVTQLQRQSSATRFEEEKIDDCVPIGSIAGVQPARENRLLLFMRDRRILTAALERACRAEDFYAGFYIERSEDGQLCTRRDRLQSRAGASCRVDQLNRLVAADD